MILNKKSFLVLLLLSGFYFIFCFELDFVPYQGSLKRVVTKNFIILFPKKYQSIAIKVANYSEDIHSKLTGFFKWKPYEKTTVVLTDHTDFPNGLGYPFFRNTIVLYLAPFDNERSLSDIYDPLYTLIVHEYAHVLHLDQIRGGAFFWRVLYGKLYSPNSGSFPWYTEGVAVLSESLYSPNGRLNSSYNYNLIMQAALNNKIPNFDEIVSINESAYQFGARFINYLYEKYGEEKFQSFFVDISNDFWPFVLLFVSKFKKIYGSSLSELWNEWKKEEKKVAEENNQKRIPTLIGNRKKIKDLTGRIYSLDAKGEFIYLSNTGYNGDRGLYKYDKSNDIIKKIKTGYFYSISVTANDDIFLYTKPVVYTGGFYFYELFSFNLKTGIEKRLTYKKRVSFVSFSKSSNIGVFVSNRWDGAHLYKARFYNGELLDVKEVELALRFDFIDQTRINDAGNKVVFAGKDKSGFFKPYLFDLDEMSLVLLEKDVIAKRLIWLDDDNIGFISKKGDENVNNISVYNIKTGDKKNICNSIGYIYDIVYSSESIYFVDNSYKGDELFVTDEINVGVVSNSKSELKNKSFIINDTEYKITGYSPFRYLYPAIWGFLPYYTNSNFYFKVGSYYMQLPLIGPQFVLYNSTPLGRFTYIATVGFNYMKYYPDNSLSVRVRLPYVNLIYKWANWAGGEKHIVGNTLYSLDNHGRYPISFSNKLELYYFYTIETLNQLGWDISLMHGYTEHDFYLGRFANTMGFDISLSYGYARKRVNYSRWNSGLYFGSRFYMYPDMLFDNEPVYLLKGELEGRVPLKKSFLYVKIEGAGELLGKNYLIARSDIFSFTDIFLNEKTTAVNVVDMKAFASGLTLSSIGSWFTYFDTGFDISLYKKEKYWHFMTLGFRELYLKPYLQFLYLYNRDNSLLRNFLFNAACEVSASLFAGYGNISFLLTFGNALGYRIYDIYPSWNIYLYISAGIL